MNEPRGSGASARPLVFGEVLFDAFPDGSLVPGGAPFNVAWHLQGFGLHPLFISRVGMDKPGERILAAMNTWGMDTSGMQRDADTPTGRVEVRFRDGEPTFDILPDCAYDLIDPAVVDTVMRGGRFSPAYHGSLVARNDVSRRALERVRAESLPLFMDVNLRDPWWERAWTIDALDRARWAKLNEEEFDTLSGTAGNPGSTLAERACEWRRSLGLEMLVVTRGAQGAILISDAGTEATAPDTGRHVVDTVGAGDGFSAAVILGISKGWPLHALARRAGDFSAGICGMRGATTVDREFYQGYLRTWK